MCGIAGLVGAPREIASARVREALARLEHRGPDGVGSYESENAILGVRRLAIIDLATGDQPIYNEDRSIAVVCNGELYNHTEGFHDLESRGHRLQSRSDINLIPHYYEEAGAAAFTKLRGMFAAAVWDAGSRRLTLARDHVGKKPLFYARTDDGLAFASELPALLALLDRTPNHSAEALADYLQLGCVPHPETIYEGVLALPPGHTLTFEAGGTPHLTSFWQPTVPPPFTGSKDDALNALDQGLQEAVALRLRSDVPVGMFLSGGIDSGLIAAYAVQAGATDLLCFVVEVADAHLNEAPAAMETANRLGLPIEIIPLSFAPLDAVEQVSLLYGQPFGDSSAVPSYFLARAASRQRKVVLNGDGGDEIFAGYRRYWVARAARWLIPLTAPLGPAVSVLGHRLAKVSGRRTPFGFAARTLRGLRQSDAARYMTWSVDLLDDTWMAKLFPDLAVLGSTTDRLTRLRGTSVSAASLRAFQRSDYRLILADDLLTKMDIATMANSLEARSPFLDIPLAEFSWSLPERWLISMTETKPLLRTLAKKSGLPASIVNAPKRGFEVPVAKWLRSDLKDVVADLLLDSASRVGAMGNRVRLRKFIDGLDDFAGNRPQVIWCLLMLEIFLRAPTPQTG
ncbi:MAG: asparagine synthase (glutamine-hydrolyzing) [Gemmatimonadetes bacterium]|nr:asparagine synthase (glutamine-hydrolyzing) [Gemmatimonadota bacterium]